MSDIDFITDFSTGIFQIDIDQSPQKVTGNRALLNRFEITFMTKTRYFLMDGSDGNGQKILDTFGGNAEKFISVPRVLNDIQAIAAAVSTTISQTVDSIKNNQDASIDKTEKLSGANLSSIDIVNNIVVARIEVIPEQAESSESMILNLPITRT